MTYRCEFAIGASFVSLLALSTWALPAAAQSVRMTPGATTTKHPDGSKTVVQPDGRTESRDISGRRRGTTRICDNGRTGGSIMTCTEHDNVIEWVEPRAPATKSR